MATYTFLAPATVLACKRDFVHGKFPSIHASAEAHGLNPGTIRNLAFKQRWTSLRAQFLAKAEAKLFEPDVVEVPQPPPASDQPNPLAALDQQINTLNNLFADEAAKPNPDPTALDRLQSALSRASERRRILLNIPLPGSHRPSRKPVRAVLDFIPAPEEADPSPTSQP